MSITSLLQFALVAIFINNVMVDRMLGVDSLLRTIRPVRSAALMGVITLLCMTIAAGCGWMVEYLLIQPLALSSWRLLIVVTMVCSVFMFIELLLHHWSIPLAERIRPLLYHSITNSAVVAAALLCGGVSPFSGGSYAIGQAVGFGFCAGLGFFGVQLVVAGICKRIELALVPAVMRGPGMVLIVCSLLALCMQGFSLLGGK